jgi:hypothetical protein
MLNEIFVVFLIPGGKCLGRTVKQSMESLSSNTNSVSSHYATSTVDKISLTTPRGRNM